MVKEWSALYVCDTFDDYKSEIVALEVTNIRNISKQFNLVLDFMDIRCYLSLIPPALRMDGPTDFSNKNLDFHNNGYCRGRDYGSKPPVLIVRHVTYFQFLLLMHVLYPVF